MKFYLGTHQPYWLCSPTFSGVRLFVSAVRLEIQCPRSRAVAPYAVDSGGFSFVGSTGGYPWTPREYCDRLLRWRDRLGPMDWAAPQDWMCEEKVLSVTGLSVRRHQDMTRRSVHQLRRMEPTIHFPPVLQGQTCGDYLRHADDYARDGIDFRREPFFGVGSVCRRQGTAEGVEIIREVSDRGIRVHGFGFKTDGLRAAGGALHSADSLAWSDGARYKPPLPGCPHKSCNNCPIAALLYREKLARVLNPKGWWTP